MSVAWAHLHVLIALMNTILALAVLNALVNTILALGYVAGTLQIGHHSNISTWNSGILQLLW